MAGEAGLGLAGHGAARHGRHGRLFTWLIGFCCDPNRAFLCKQQEKKPMANQLKVTPVRVAKLRFGIRGTSPLIQHNWSEKGLRQMRLTAAERRKQPKVARNPEEEAEAATYKTEDGRLGVPILAIKSAIITAAHKDLGIEKTLVKKSLFFPCDDANKCVPLTSEEPPICREDIVRVGANQTDLRYRPEYAEWRLTVECEVDTEALSQQDVVNLVNRAGFGVGIGEWRPEKGGEYGRFEIDTNVAMEVVG
jgi:hypothetical protein